MASSNGINSGDIVRGRIAKFNLEAAFVDLGERGEGFVPLSQLVGTSRDGLPFPASIGVELEFLVAGPKDVSGRLPLTLKRAETQSLGEIIGVGRRSDGSAESNVTIAPQKRAARSGSVAETCYNGPLRDVFIVVSQTKAGTTAFASRLLRRGEKSLIGDLHISSRSLLRGQSLPHIGQLIFAAISNDSNGRTTAGPRSVESLDGSNLALQSSVLLGDLLKALEAFKRGRGHDQSIEFKARKHSKEILTILAHRFRDSDVPNLETLARLAADDGRKMLDVLVEQIGENLLREIAKALAFKDAGFMSTLFSRLPKESRADCFFQLLENRGDLGNEELIGIATSDRALCQRVLVSSSFERYRAEIVQTLVEAGPGELWTAVNGVFGLMDEQAQIELFSRLVADSEDSALPLLCDAARTAPLLKTLFEYRGATICQTLSGAGPAIGVTALNGLFDRLPSDIRTQISDGWIDTLLDSGDDQSARAWARNSKLAVSPLVLERVHSRLLSTTLPVFQVPYQMEDLIPVSASLGSAVATAEQLRAAREEALTLQGLEYRAKFIKLFHEVSILERLWGSVDLQLLRGETSPIVGLQQEVMKSMDAYQGFVNDEAELIKLHQDSLIKGDLGTIPPPLTVVGKVLFHTLKFDRNSAPDALVNFLHKQIIDAGLDLRLLKGLIPPCTYRDLHSRWGTLTHCEGKPFPEGMTCRTEKCPRSQYEVGKSKFPQVYFLNDALFAIGVKNSEDLVRKIAGWLNRLSEIPFHFFCHNCESLLMANLDYTKYSDVYRVTVFHCLNKECKSSYSNSDFQVYLNHCVVCARTVDSRTSQEICEEGLYLCSDRYCKGCCSQHSKKWRKVDGRWQRCGVFAEQNATANEQRIEGWDRLRSEFLRALLTHRENSQTEQSKSSVDIFFYSESQTAI